MNTSKKLLAGILTVLIAGAATLTGCSKSTSAASASSSAKKTYIIACDATYAPFSMEVDGKYKGIDVELLDAIAKAEGFQYTLKPMVFDGIIPAIKSGEIDGSIAGMNITDVRKQSVDFSDGYIQCPSSIVVRDTNTSVHSLDDLKGKTAALKKGTTGAAFCEENQAKYSLKLTYYNDSPSMDQAVENGNADFFIEDYPVVSYMLKTDKTAKLRIAVKSMGNAPYDGFAVNKGQNQELLKMFNDGLKKVKANGTYDKIVNQYL